MIDEPPSFLIEFCNQTPIFSLMPANILNLAAYEVCKIDSDDHNYHIEVAVVVAPATCQACDSESIVGFGHKEQLIKDIPFHGKRVGIYIDTRRFQCRSCNKTFYESLPALQRKLVLPKVVFAISFATTLTSSSKPFVLKPLAGWGLMRFI